MQIDVRPDHLGLIKNALMLHVPDRQVVAFGSRVKWTAKDTSDLDICVMGEEKIPFETLAALRDELSNSNLPYKVDVVDWASIKPDFKKIIAAQSYEIKAPEDKGWSYKRLSDAALINPSVKLAKDVIYPFVDMAVIEPGKKFVEPSEQRPFSGGGSRFAHGDTLMARITPCLENGKIAMFHGRNESEVAHGSTEFIVFRGRPDVSDNEFIYYLVTSPEVRSFAIGQMTGSSGRQRVPTSAFDYITVGLPPLSEQSTIASALKKLDDKIELNGKMNETLEATAQALFRSWFVDFEQWKGNQPKEWKSKPLDSQIELIGGGTPKTSVSEYWEGDIPWFSMADVPAETDVFVIDTEKQITQAGIENSSTKILPIGTTIITARGTVGKLALVGTPMAMNQSCYGVQGKSGATYYTYFLLKKAIAELQKNTHGSVFDTITRATFSSIQVVEPSKAIMRQFDNAVEPLLKKIHSNVKDNKLLSQLRDTLLPKLISGELRVSEAASKVKEAV